MSIGQSFSKNPLTGTSPNVNDLSISQLCTGMFLTVPAVEVIRAMLTLVRHIFFVGSPPKVADVIIFWIAVVVSHLM